MHGHSERKKEREPISYINHTYPVNQIKKLKGTLWNDIYNCNTAKMESCISLICHAMN